MLPGRRTRALFMRAHVLQTAPLEPEAIISLKRMTRGPENSFSRLPGTDLSPGYNSNAAVQRLTDSLIVISCISIYNTSE